MEVIYLYLLSALDYQISPPLAPGAAAGLKVPLTLPAGGFYYLTLSCPFKSRQSLHQMMTEVPLA